MKVHVSSPMSISAWVFGYCGMSLYVCMTAFIRTCPCASLNLYLPTPGLGSRLMLTSRLCSLRYHFLELSHYTSIDRLSIIWKSDLTDKMKRSLFQAAVVSILLYGFTARTLTKRLEKKVDGNYTRMLRAILNKSWRQHPTRHQLYGHLPPNTKTIQVRRTRHAGHCRRSKDELISDLLLWTPAYGRAKAGRPAWTYIQQLCEDTGCSPEDLQEAVSDKEKWQERVRDIRASGTTWWWGWYLLMFVCLYICMYVCMNKWMYQNSPPPARCDKSILSEVPLVWTDCSFSWTGC